MTTKPEPTAEMATSQDEADDIVLASRFMLAVHDRGDDLQPATEKPLTLTIFEAFETDETGKSMAGLLEFLFTSARDMGQQLAQALIDAEATSE